MHTEILKGIFIPLLGTILGSCCVFFLKSGLSHSLVKFLSAFAAGVMTAASVWSLLLPAIEYSEKLGTFAFLPAAVGFFLGISALIIIDRFIPLGNLFKESGDRAHKTAMLVISVTAHNLPEGVAVGAVYAALLMGDTEASLAGALALSIGIALQNFPEGAIISMPLYASGVRKWRAFFIGALSGIVEPLGAALAIIAARYLSALPWLLGFAAGAMIYVVVEELIPELCDTEKNAVGIISYTFGFLLMMILDVTLG